MQIQWSVASYEIWGDTYRLELKRRRKESSISSELKSGLRNAGHLLRKISSICALLSLLF